VNLPIQKKARVAQSKSMEAVMSETKRYEARMYQASRKLEATTLKRARTEAKAWAADGDWDTAGGTIWLHCWVIEIDEAGKAVEDGDEECITVGIDPEEPECADGKDHDWQSPIEIVGGTKENPGVCGHGGGVIMTEVCMHCGCEKVTDTWAQDPETGEQGLESVQYDEDKYADHELVGLHTYTVRTDGSHAEGILAKTIDDAARIYAEDEFPGAGIGDVADLFAEIERIGDGAWCWIEGDGPDGNRQSIVAQESSRG
jgi:hypothetical protein